MRIDWWTLALQTVNVLILIWLLDRFFFRPIMDIVAKRQQEADKLLSDAAHVRDRAADERAAAEKASSELAAERENLLVDARKAAEIEHGKLLAQATQQIAKLREEATAGIARERAAAEAAIIERASDLSVDIARRLLARLRQQDLLPTFIDGIGRELRALSAEARENLASAATPGHPLEVVSAAPLADAEIQCIQSMLKQVFGRELPMAFRSDPAIINGLELVGRNTVVRNSWRADLDRIRHELNRDRQADQS
jgi:F-type H+-transporting ATPase subunit b